MNRVRRTTESFIKECQNKYPNVSFDYSKVIFKTLKTKVIIECPIHGDFEILPQNFLKDSNIYGCPKCGFENGGTKRRITISEFIQRAKEVHGDRYNYSKTFLNTTDQKVIIICPKHGEFTQFPENHLRGCGCPKCQCKSQAILYERLKQSFPECEVQWEARVSWLNGLRFDIYFPKYNIAVEYDGQQHFIPVEKFGGELGFEKTQIRDELKNKLCKEHNCILFRIKYDYTELDYQELIQKIVSYA